MQGEASSSSGSRCIRIGLINNMPDTALEATERQFRSLLATASDGMSVRLLSLPWRMFLDPKRESATSRPIIQALTIFGRMTSMGSSSPAQSHEPQI